ncbi:MAG: glycosyltransferase family 4 protein [Roseibium sp.]|nr:glycosyltransferase family 4 protein [Roseibium sp.]
MNSFEKDVVAAADPQGFQNVRVVHVVRQYVPMVGGLEDVVRNLAAQQLGRFESVKIVTLDRLFTDLEVRLPERDVIDGIDVVRIPFSGSTRYPLAPSVFRHIADADIVHVHAVDFFFDALGLARPFHRKKLVATTHGGFFHTTRHAWLKKAWFQTMTRLTANRYDALACCGENDHAMFQRVVPAKVRLIENGVDLEKFADAAARIPSKRLVTIGRFSANKHLDRVFDALRLLAGEDPAWRLDVIGSPSDWSAEDVDEAIRERGLSSKVTVHTGLSDRQLRSVLGSASLFVSASAYEGFGLAMIEALSAGLVPVVQPNAAFTSLAGRHSMVRLADFGDPGAAAGAIHAAFADLSSRKTLRAEAMSSARQHSWHATIKHYDALYKDVLSNC